MKAGLLLALRFGLNLSVLIHSPSLRCGGSGITLCSPLRFGSNPAASHPLTFTSLRWERDSNPRYSFPYDSLANCWFQPLTHPTKFKERTAKVVNFVELNTICRVFMQIFKNNTCNVLLSYDLGSSKILLGLNFSITPNVIQ